jgi:hypothetical protein
MPTVVRESLQAALEDGRFGLAGLLYGLDPEAHRDLAWSVGCFLNVVLTGFMAKWLVDQDRAPTGRQLADGLRVVVAG